jgi:multidrug resistance efflux pump
MMTEESESEKDEIVIPEQDPVRQWTLRLLVLTLILLVCYLIADRVTPFSTQARVHALVVPVAAEVSGTVSEVLVSSNQRVQAGDVLFRVDPSQYELAVASAEASLESARQSAGASEAGVTAAAANVKSAQANLERSAQDAKRLNRIRVQDPGAISIRRIESAEASLEVARQQLVAAEAGLEQARQNAGQAGDSNSQIKQALAARDQARLDIERTAVRAPTNGVVTDVRLDRGNFVGAGQPQMTFISTSKIWVQADFTENNLGNVDLDDAAEVLFDVYPGRVFKGRVRDLSFGVAVDSAPLGSLPSVSDDRQWLRSAQRFPVVIDFEMEPEDRVRLRVGAQASVMIYASKNWLFDAMGKLYLRISSLLSYAY